VVRGSLFVVSRANGDLRTAHNEQVSI